MKWLLSLQLLKEIKTETGSGFIVIVVSIFTIKLVCHGESLVKLQAVYHKYHFPDISLGFFDLVIQFLKPANSSLKIIFWDSPTGRQSHSLLLNLTKYAQRHIATGSLKWTDLPAFFLSIASL